MLNKLSLLVLLALTIVAASAADEQTPAPKSSDLPIARAIAWAVIGAAGQVERIERPSETPAEQYIGKGRDGYLAFARSDERGETKGKPEAVKQMLTKTVGEALAKELVKDLEGCTKVEVTGKTVADLYERLWMDILWGRIPAYRKIMTDKVATQGDTVKALAQCVMAGQAIRVLEAEAKAKAEGTTKL